MGIIDTVVGVLSLLASALGWALLTLVFMSTVLILTSLLLIAYQFKTGNFLFPNLLVAGIDFFESPIRVVLRVFKIDEMRIDRIAIRLKNQAMYKKFSQVPFNKRAVFLPQCLRSITCPAALSPEGIKCRDCGACGISRAQKEAKKLGYMFFVVPGSSFIMRMIQKYRPEAIIGVGCMCEVRYGLDMMHRYRIPAVGVMLEKSGCVSTELNWDRLFKVMNAIEDTDFPGSEKVGSGSHEDSAGN
jgi:hypothetical protein